MDFGPLKVSRAKGAILAHSQRAGRRVLKKGRVLSAEDIAALRAAGVETVTVARLDPGEIGEDAAATALALALAGTDPRAGLRLSAAHAGRVNVHARRAGLLRVDGARVTALNRLSPAISLATLPDCSQTAPGQLLATVKIVTYGLAQSLLEQAAGAPGLSVMPVMRKSAALLMTRTPGMKQALLDKGRRATAERLRRLEITLSESMTCAHETGALAGALGTARGEILLILTGSATADIRDVGPAALLAAGGEIIRFGLPVDPGNLLFLGRLGARPVIGLPGCARSLALNGADGVLARIACGLDPDADQMAQMGVGGLLKETRLRPAPRERG